MNRRECIIWTSFDLVWSSAVIWESIQSSVSCDLQSFSLDICIPHVFDIVKMIYDGAFGGFRSPVASVRPSPDITELSRTSSSASTEVVLEYWSWRAAILDRDALTSKVVPVIPLKETSAKLLRTSVSVLDSKDRLHLSLVIRNAMYVVPVAIRRHYCSTIMIA